MGCFNDPAWKVCGGGWWGGWLTPTTYIQLAGARLKTLDNCNKTFLAIYVQFSRFVLLKSLNIVCLLCI